MTDWSAYSGLFTRIIFLMVMFGGLLSLPLLPGLVIIWVAALVFGIVSGFGTLGWVMFGLMTFFMLAGTIVDNVLMGAQAHKEGAPWWAVMLALLAALVGGFFIPIPIVGGILAGLLTLFGIEWIRRKDWRKALTSLKGMLVGWGWAFVIRFIIGMIMIGLWLIWAWV
ncbi:MAG TPA: DUF456 domain-containing protein [Anaerolineales bacterium]|nr:DUF456 domain-containing protein [Anaerolineales bacterium]